MLTLRFNPDRSTRLSCAALAFLCACMRPAALVLVCAISMAGLTVPARAQSEQTLVSNIEQFRDVFILRQQGAYQAFTTGNNDLGYVVTSVEVYFTSGSASASHITASLHRMNSGEPGDKVADLINPDSIVAGSNVFSVPSGTVLSAGTDYAVVFSISGNWNLGGTYSRREDSGSQSDWSIEDTYYNLVGSGYTAPLGRFSLMIRVNGVVTQPPSDDATLGGLTLIDTGDGAVELDPAFTADKLEYSALVPTDVTSITLDATANHSGAALKFMNGKELDLTDMDPDTEGFQVALMVGENIFKVQVEAENGEKRIYTVNVTRQGAPISLSLDTIAADGIVNSREKADGFTVSGFAEDDEMGGMSAISVTVDIGDETLTATTDASGEWSVTVPPDADYISEPGVSVTVNAIGPHMSTAPELTRDLNVDLTPPALVSAVVDENLLTLTFDESLAERAVSPGVFSVSVNGEVLSGQIAVAAGGNSVTLLLDLPVTVSAGDTVTFSYEMPEGSNLDPIFDPAGNEVEPLNDYPAENGTPIGERCAGSEGSIRLMNGSDEKEGRVEICADDDTGDNTPASWGTVCDDYWTNDDADVACMALGYEGAEPDAGRFLRSRFGAGTGPIWLDDMLCEGDEAGLLDCPTARRRTARDLIGVHNCKSSEVVGVRCMAAGEERTLSVADATVEEGAQLAFRVSLNEAADWEVSVKYLTRNYTATAGADYEDVSGTLTFAAGETAKTVTVVTLDDAVDDDGETLILHLRYAFGARIEDSEATGTIHNSDPLPKGWLSRFGRTSAAHVVDMLDDRFDEVAVPFSQLTLGGQTWRLTERRADTRRVRAGVAPAESNDALPDYTADWSDPSRITEPASTGTGSAGIKATPLERTLWGLLTNSSLQSGKRRFISQSSFNLSLSGPSPAYQMQGQAFLRKQESSEQTVTGGDISSIETITAVPEVSGRWSLWGRGALTHFGGVDESVNLQGDVLTGLLGLDYARERWLAGVALSYSDGNGTYQAPGIGVAGDLDSTLVSVHPYLRYALTARLSVWGTLGYGAGTLRLHPGRDQDAIETDMQMSMGALGLRGIVYATQSTELALKSDALWVRTTSDAAPGLQAVDGADVSRVRLLLSGRHERVLANGGVITPSIELGVRYDDGDAETGMGVELGGGLRYADPLRGLTVETTARTLLAHEDGGYEEWGVGGTLQFDPGVLGRGPAFSLVSAWGVTGSGAQELWLQQDMAGLARGHYTDPEGRIKAEWSYGLDVPWTNGIQTPYSSMELAGSGRTMRLGWRFELGQFSLSLDGERRETSQEAPDHTLMLRTSLPW